MKNKLLLTLLSLALVGATSSLAAGGGRGAGRGGSTFTPPGSGSAPGVPAPKKDGTGGPGKPANPAGPQDGSSPGPGPKGPRT